MGRQICVCLIPSDLIEFEKMVSNTGDISFLNFKSSVAKPSIRNNVRMDGMGEEELTIFLSRREDLNALTFNLVPAQNYWSVDSLRSPVIEFSRTFYNGSIIRPGRLYYNLGYYGEDGRWIEKGQPFLEWAKHLFNCTRAALSRIKKFDCYLGQEALIKIEHDGLSFTSV